MADMFGFSQPLSEVWPGEPEPDEHAKEYDASAICKECNVSGVGVLPVRVHVRVVRAHYLTATCKQGHTQVWGTKTL